ncbi:MAG: hypothetical protein OXN84_15295 [Albidovulum sp.]|nr:hypothetical protein [Albidovulum sp.]
MPDTFSIDGNALTIRFNSECVRVEAWGKDALRTRARPGGRVVEPHASALLEPSTTKVEASVDGKHARIRNGRIEARVRIARRLGADVQLEPVISYFDTVTDDELLAEARPHFAGPPPRHFKALASGSFQLEAAFKAYDDEHLMGLGQPQHGREDLKGTSTNLVQQNSHVVIPFVISSRGYGFLWNNPAVGRVEFATNISRWRAEATPGLDYWITAGETPEQILRNYVDVSGHPPPCPDWVTGFWQSKLRYRSQQEILEVARAYRRRGLPLSCIVIDFFAWTNQGEWEFDPQDWPDPEGLARELEEMNVKTIVSVWPTVNANSKYYADMRERGYLLGAERGVPAMIQFPDKDPLGVHFLAYYDAFNPDARDFHWDKAKRNYFDRGIRNFWLDACEPEMRPAHAENIRTYKGNGAEMLSAYPLLHAERYAEGLTDSGAEDAALLCRSSWAGGHRYPVILWSGDVRSTWEDFRAQIAAGLHAAMSGFGWWASDIGGFYEGHADDPDFRELLVRWFEFGIFSPVCRLHGVRVPGDVPHSSLDGEVDYGRDLFRVFTETGGDNEIWSYGPELEEILGSLLKLRERLRPYLGSAMSDYAKTGVPPMRPLPFAFPHDTALRRGQGAYMFGPDLLVAPVLSPFADRRQVLLPNGPDWVHVWTGEKHEAGRTVTVRAPVGNPPVFCTCGRWKEHRELFETA